MKSEKKGLPVFRNNGRDLGFCIARNNRQNSFIQDSLLLENVGRQFHRSLGLESQLPPNGIAFSLCALSCSCFFHRREVVSYLQIKQVVFRKQARFIISKYFLSTGTLH